MQKSIKKRFAISLFANAGRGLLSFLAGLILARNLGPENYGVFSFLLASFTAVLMLLDMGSSSAFYTFISKRNRTIQFFFQYYLWLAVQFIVMLFFISLLAPDEWLRELWQGQEKKLILLAFVAVYLQKQVWNMVGQLGESQRLTHLVQPLNFAVAGVHIGAILILLFLEALSIELVFILIIVEYFLFVILAFIIFPVEYEQISPDTTFRMNFKNRFLDYKTYCAPLIFYSGLSMVAAFADTWLLQKFGGATEQAYYSVAAQFSYVSLILTMSLLRILWKEVAAANEKGDLERAGNLIAKTSRVLFFVGAVISGMLIPWTSEIIRVILGESYVEGAIVMTIMLLYPVHQSLGQISGSSYLALEETRSFAIISGLMLTLGLIFTYFLIAPSSAMVSGLGLGSIGLAIKMVSVQFIGVNFMLWWLHKKKGWTYSWVFQLSLPFLVGCGFLIKRISQFFLPEVLMETFIFNSILYGFFIITFCYVLPSILGLKRSELNHMIVKLIRK